jgi:hypothetical protein
VALPRGFPVDRLFQITHAIETHHYGSQEKTPSYRKLDADYYHQDGTVSFVVIPAHPGAESRGPFSDDLPRADSTSWVCGHCTKFVCAPQTFQAVNGHVKTEYVCCCPSLLR